MSAALSAAELAPGRLELRPITLQEARRFVATHHRHNGPPLSWNWGVGLARGEELVGVAMAGRPVSRHLDDGRTVEVLRTCTLGDRNANSRLYAAVCRAAAAMGYRRAVTYTLESESGASLRAAGFEPVYTTRDQVWARGTRPRQAVSLWGEPTTPEGRKVRWERAL